MTQASASESPRANVRFNPTRSRFDAAADAHDAMVGVSCALPVNVGELEAARVRGWMCMGVRKALSSRARMRPQLAVTAWCRWPTPPSSTLRSMSTSTPQTASVTACISTIAAGYVGS